MTIPYHLSMVDWQAVFFDARTNWPDRMARRARRRFSDRADGEAAYNYALERISADGWQILHSGYTARGTPEGFLAITFIHLLEEYAVRKYGRLRPPVWLRRLGRIWEQIYRMLCLKRMAPETIVARLAPGSSMNSAELHHAIREIRGRVVNCGRHLGETPDTDLPPRTGTPDPGPAENLEEAELFIVLDVLRGLLRSDPGQTPDPNRPVPATTAVQQRVPAVRAALALSETERLLLKLVYLEGHSIASSARAQRTPVHKARRTHARLLARIAKALAPLGFGEG